MLELNRLVARSAQRLSQLIAMRGCRSMIEHEASILVERLTILVGPEKLRKWIDQAIDREVDSVRQGT